MELALCPRGYPFQHFPVLKGYSATAGSFSPRLRGFVAFGAHNLQDGSHFKCFATTGAFPGDPRLWSGKLAILSSLEYLNKRTGEQAYAWRLGR